MKTKIMSKAVFEALHRTCVLAAGVLEEKAEIQEWVQKTWGLAPVAQKQFLLGIIPPEQAQWKKLLSALLGEGITNKILLATGAWRISPKGNLQPAFPGRLLIPYLQQGKARYLIARQTPWSPQWDLKTGKYKKLPLHDPRNRTEIHTCITNRLLLNEDALEAEPGPVIIVEGIMDCLRLMEQGFLAISPGAVKVPKADLERLAPRLRRSKGLYVCFDREFSLIGDVAAIELALELAAEGLTPKIVSLPLFKEQQAAWRVLEKGHQLPPGASQEMVKAALPQETVERLLGEAKQDVASYLLGRKGGDFDRLLKKALSPQQAAAALLPPGEPPREGDPRWQIVMSLLRKVPALELEDWFGQVRERVGKEVLSLGTLRKALQEAKGKRKRALPVKEYLPHGYPAAGDLSNPAAGGPICEIGGRNVYLVNEGLAVEDRSRGGLKNLTNAHLVYTEEHYWVDGHGIQRRTYLGQVRGVSFVVPVEVPAEVLAKNAEFLTCLTRSVGSQMIFTDRSAEVIRTAAHHLSPDIRRMIRVEQVGLHEKAGYLTPSVQVKGGQILPTLETSWRCLPPAEYPNLAHLDLAMLPFDEAKPVFSHLMKDFLSVKSWSATIPLLAFMLAPPVLFEGLRLGEFSPFYLHLVGPSGAGKTELCRLAMNLWGDFSHKARLATCGSTPEFLFREGAFIRGMPRVIDDFKESHFGGRQLGNFYRSLANFGDGQSRSRATTGERMMPGRHQHYLLLLNGEHRPTQGSALAARGLTLVVGQEQNPSSYRACLEAAHQYRGLTPHYLAWLQRQNPQEWAEWVTLARQELEEGLGAEPETETGNLRRLAGHVSILQVTWRLWLAFLAANQIIQHSDIATWTERGEQAFRQLLADSLQQTRQTGLEKSFLLILGDLIATGELELVEEANFGKVKGDSSVVGYFAADGKSLNLLPRRCLEAVQTHLHRSGQNRDSYTLRHLGPGFKAQNLLLSWGKNEVAVKVRPKGGKGMAPQSVWAFDRQKVIALWEGEGHE